jgi:hypothetical protein
MYSQYDKTPLDKLVAVKLLVHELEFVRKKEGSRMRLVAKPPAGGIAALLFSLSCANAFQSAALLPGLRAPGGTHHRLPFAACSSK